MRIIMIIIYITWQIDWTLVQVWIEFGSHTSLEHLKHDVAALVLWKNALRCQHVNNKIWIKIYLKKNTY